MDKAELLIAVIAVVVSVVAIIVSLVTSSRKYENSISYYDNVLGWYHEVILIINKLQADNNSENRIILSSLIDKGRFYFPNIVIDNYGAEKPSAYKGYRVIVLDLLIASYNVFKLNKSLEYNNRIEQIKRHFTSEIYDYLKPNLKKINVAKYTNYLSSDKTIINSLQDFEKDFALFLIKSNLNELE